MQLIESSIIGLRSARHRMASGSKRPVVTLFPMVHIGEPDFYETVYAQACKADVVLTEGIQSPMVRRLTRSYRWIDLENLGLVLQPRFPTPPPGCRVLNADLSGDEFEAAWRDLPLWLRFAAPQRSAFVGLRHRLRLSRQSLVSGVSSLNDKASRASAFEWDTPGYDLAGPIRRLRDDRLCSILLGLLEENHDREMSISVVYGASHMPAVLRLLRTYGEYRPAGSEWLTAISL